MNDFRKMLMHKASLKKACNGLSLDEIEKVLADLTDIARRRREEAKALKKEAAARRKKVEAIRKKIEKSGVDMSDLVTQLKSPGKKPAMAKYRLKDKDGNVHTWSGRGRQPRLFKEQFEAGHTKEEFLITH